MNQGFKHTDKLTAVELAESNSLNSNSIKSIAVQHFNDSGLPDSPASLITVQAGHSPIAEAAINGGYFVATELDPQQDQQNSSLLQLERSRQNQGTNRQQQYANR